MADRPRPRTVGELRDALAARLRGAVSDPMSEARDLLAMLHDAPRSWAMVHAQDDLIDLLIDAADDAVDKRLAGAPMAYAVGRAAFRHLFLHVDERVLIPRPETEELVTLALPYVAPGATVVDVGTGSGAIALAVAQESEAGRVIGTDLSAEAIEVAEMNARAVLRREYARTEFLQGNLLEPVLGDRIDVIVSNPPYIALTERGELPDAVARFEPEMALFGGADGLEVIRALVAQAEAGLTAGGVLLMEVDARRGPEALALVAGPQWRDSQLLPDAFGRDRFVVVRRTATSTAAATGSQTGASLPRAQ
ncbi:MAG: peptide chain release factor N(5)-glutamine methyltransferase [Gemmatimonadaceae bacterium]|nr:peptide chain release factor N(5)-glutamine methyltransferase [Gemmatimonadaceae bacterium]